jgi:hypothetical protein
VLYLNPPFFTIEGVVVGRDYSDPRQFWYFPNRPRLATDDQGRPALRFLVYREDLSEIVGDDDVGAGFVFFDTQLAWPEATLAKVASRLKRDLRLDEEPRLAPLLFKSGKVKLIFLARSSEPADPPPDGGPPSTSDDWVTVLESAGTPSLYGENRAIFSVALTKKAASLLLGSFDGFIPAGVTYELTYVAMQRAFQVKVEADWELAYHYVREYEQERVFFFNDECEKIVEKLEEKKIIKITASLEGVGDEGMQGEFAEVRKQLSQFVFEKFFEPKVNPKELLDRDVPNAILGFLGGLRDGGLPVQVGASKRELDVSQIRQLDIDYTVVRAVERVIAPQGHLSVFWADFAPQITRDDVVTVVTGDQDIWRQVEVRVLAAARFGPADVEKIIVDLAYGPMAGDEPVPSARRFSVVLDAAQPGGAVRDWYDPGIGATMHYRYTVVFGPDAVVSEGVGLTSPWAEAEGAVVTIETRQLYHDRRVEFQRSGTLSKQIFPEVLAHLRYVDGDWTYHASGVLGVDNSPWQVKFHTRADASPRVEYKLEFLRDGQDPIDTGWRPTEEEAIVVRDPRTNLFHVKLLVADPASLMKAIVDFEYADPANGVFESGSLTVNQDNVNDELEWVFHRVNPTADRYRYRQVLVDTDGVITRTGWIQADENTLLIGKIYAAQWKVRPEVSGGPLASVGLEKIVVTIRYDDDQHNYHEESAQTFTAPGVGAPLILELRDPDLRRYQYTVRYVRTDGFEHKVGPSSGSDTFLTVPARPPVG